MHIQNSRIIAHLAHSKMYEFVNPSSSSKPSYVLWNSELSKSLNLLQTDSILSLLSGRLTPPELKPIATRYGGHQFGHWAGQLGDGRAILLGEVNSNEGIQTEIQLKGAGLTPYSRRGDGKAVLRSSLREYLCSEAMQALGVPTTRALTLISTGDLVTRDFFYDGNPKEEPGAICVRTSESFLRFGHFEILLQDQDRESMNQLLEFVLTQYYPGRSPQEFYEELCVKTAELIVDWLRVGFVHGVMNTDNMSVLGLTIDYGPYGWMDIYDPTWTPNTTDAERRRYAFQNQPEIAFWNLERLGDALSLVGIHSAKGLAMYQEVFRARYLQMRASKLGIEANENSIKCLEGCEELLLIQECDYTIFYRELTEGRIPTIAYYSHLNETQELKLKNWFQNWKSMKPDFKLMSQLNPVFILRNYLVQEVLDLYPEQEKFAKSLTELTEALKTPYEWNALTKQFYKQMPNWARSKPGCSALSCSS